MASPTDPLATALKAGRLLVGPLRELWLGVRTNSIPWAACSLVSAGMLMAILLHWDARLVRHFGFAALYPRHSLAFGIYVVTAASSGLFIWSAYRAALFNQFERRLDLALVTSGLRNRLGKTPVIVTDVPIDQSTRKLRLTSANFPRGDFESARSALEAGLRVYIDEIKEDRGAGCFDIIYSRFPMPSSANWGGIDGMKSLQFVVGETRSRQIRETLRGTPHLLVAGQTGGGKSTFLRQLITTLYLRNDGMDFVLFDFKGGLEFQLFENLPRVKVVPTVAAAANDLMRIEKLMQDRMAILKSQKAKDIDALAKKLRNSKSSLDTSTKPKAMHRMLLVVDEASEMFLAGTHASATEIQKARQILSQVARQGRAVGVHLVVATQRPDVRALDPQIKANLTGVLCFPMSNDASSMTVLGNGRATDLPAIPGRALWKSGMEMTEVQTPFLSIEGAESVLDPLRKQLPSGGASQPVSMNAPDGSQADTPKSPLEMT